MRYIEGYLPTFGFILADLGRFRVLAQLYIFMYIKAYSEPMAYWGIFRTADIFSQFQILLKSNSWIFWILIEQIQTYLELLLIWARIVSLIFRHIHKVTHFEEYLLTLGFRHIQDPGSNVRFKKYGSSNVKKRLLFKSGSSFKSLFRSIWNIFSFYFKSKHSTCFSSG